MNAAMNCRVTYEVGNVASMGERGGRARFWWGKPGGNNPLRRPRRRWEDNINLLNTKRRLFYLRNQFVPRCCAM